MDYTSTQTITEKYKVVKYAIPAIVTTHKRVVTMVRMTVVNITGILIPDSCLYTKKGWSTSSEKSDQHRKNRRSRWIGRYNPHGPQAKHSHTRKRAHPAKPATKLKYHNVWTV